MCFVQGVILLRKCVFWLVLVAFLSATVVAADNNTTVINCPVVAPKCSIPQNPVTCDFEVSTLAHLQKMGYRECPVTSDVSYRIVNDIDASATRNQNCDAVTYDTTIAGTTSTKVDVVCSACDPAKETCRGFFPIGQASIPKIGNSNRMWASIRGGGHVIRGLYMDRSTLADQSPNIMAPENVKKNPDYVGPFGYGDMALVDSLGMENVRVIGSMGVGGMFGNCYTGYRTALYVKGGVVRGGSSGLGGLVGGISGYWQGSVGSDLWSELDTISGGPKTKTGGIFGALYAEMSNVYSSTRVIEGTMITGGVGGENSGSEFAYGFSKVGKLDCLSGKACGALMGALSGHGYLGRSYWMTPAQGLLPGVDSLGPYLNPLLTDSMSGATLLDSTAYIGWDFAKHWFMGKYHALPRAFAKEQTIAVNNVYTMSQAVDLPVLTAGGEPIVYEWDNQDWVTRNENGKLVFSKTGTFKLHAFLPNDGSPFWLPTHKYFSIHVIEDVQGEGTLANPFLINHFAHLQLIGQGKYGLDKAYRLNADIDAAASATTPMKPIGDGVYTGFTGIFDGNGFSIRNLQVKSTNSVGAGLFARIGSSSPLGGKPTVHNLNIRKGSVTGKEYVGCVAGYTEGIFDHVFCDASIDGTSGHVGGMVGFAGNTSLSGLAFAGNVMAHSAGFVGGLAGELYNTTLEKSYSAGSLRNDSGAVGNCYAYTPIAGRCQCWGGFAGVANESTIRNSYTTGFIAQSGQMANNRVYAGGMVGYVPMGTTTLDRVHGYLQGNVYNTWGANSVYSYVEKGGTVILTQCYRDFSVRAEKWYSGEGASLGLCYFEPTDNLKKQVTFSGWDFENVWSIDEGKSYPTLRGLMNAPMGYRDTVPSFRLMDPQLLLQNDYLGGDTRDLSIARVTSVPGGSSHADSLLYMPAALVKGDSVTITYRVGRVAEGDTIWGNELFSRVILTDFHFELSADTKIYGDAPLSTTAANSQGYPIYYQTSDSSVAVPESNGQFKIMGSGKATLTALIGPKLDLSAELTVLPRPLKLMSGKGVNRSYDGTNVVTISDAVLGNVVGLDSVFLLQGHVADRHVGSDKAVVYSTADLSGSRAAHYSLASAPGLVSSITAAPLSIDSLQVADKVYDGTDSAQVTHAVLSLAHSEDVVNLKLGKAHFDAAAVGTGRVVTLSGSTISGPHAGNYLINDQSTGTGNILPAPLSIRANDLELKNGATIRYTFSYTGFVGGDNAAAVSGLKAKRIATDTAGVYRIEPYGASAANYDIHYETGRLVFSAPVGMLADASATSPKAYWTGTGLRVENWEGALSVRRLDGSLVAKLQAHGQAFYPLALLPGIYEIVLENTHSRYTFSMQAR